MTSPTSLNAAESVRPHLPRLRAEVYDALSCFPRNGLTDEELIAFTGLRANTVRPRRCELVASGLVIDSGQTRPTNSGRDSTVWRVATAEEREAFEAGRAERELNDLAQAADEAWAKYDAIRERFWRAVNERDAKRQERQREVTP